MISRLGVGVETIGRYGFWDGCLGFWLKRRGVGDRIIEVEGMGLYCYRLDFFLRCLIMS